MKVLYIEDQDSDAKLFVYLLKIAAITRGQEIEVRHIKSLPDYDALACDLVLLDTKLNGGAELTLGWVRQMPEGSPPVFMLSGLPDYEKECLDAGAAGFMDKNRVVKNALELIDQMQSALRA